LQDYTLRHKILLEKNN